MRVFGVLLLKLIPVRLTRTTAVITVLNFYIEPIGKLVVKVIKAILSVLLLNLVTTFCKLFIINTFFVEITFPIM